MRWLFALLLLTGIAVAQTSAQPLSGSNTPSAQPAQSTATDERGTDKQPLSINPLTINPLTIQPPINGQDFAHRRRR